MNEVKKTTLENLDFLTALGNAEHHLRFALDEITYPNWIDESMNKAVINNLKDTIDSISRIKECVANGVLDILRPE